MAELIRLGAYRRGSDPKVDEAIKYYDAIEAFLGQEIGDVTDLDSCYRLLAETLEMPAPDPEHAAAPADGAAPAA